MCRCVDVKRCVVAGWGVGVEAGGLGSLGGGAAAVRVERGADGRGRWVQRKEFIQKHLPEISRHGIPRCHDLLTL